MKLIKIRRLVFIALGGTHGLESIAVGTPAWSARHIWWRFYWCQYRRFVNSNGPQMQIGEDWYPSVPLPFYRFRRECRCGRRFWTNSGYSHHWQIAHSGLGHVYYR